MHGTSVCGTSVLFNLGLAEKQLRKYLAKMSDPIRLGSVAFALLVACGGGGEPEGPTVDSGQASNQVRQLVALRAVAQGTDGAPATLARRAARPRRHGRRDLARSRGVDRGLDSGSVRGFDAVRRGRGQGDRCFFMKSCSTRKYAMRDLLSAKPCPDRRRRAGAGGAAG